MIEKSERLKRIPPYLFAEIRRKIRAAEAGGADVINLAIGDPVEPTPAPVIDELCRAARLAENHRYPTRAEKGMDPLREEICRWYSSRYGIELNAETECLLLIGSKEASHHFALAMIDPGDTVLVTDPGYPTYASGVTFAGGEVYRVPILAENGFLPDLAAIPPDVAKQSKAFYLNYPNNPTGAVATRDFLEKLVKFTRDREIIIVYDNPYMDFVFDGAEPLSILNVEGARETAVEFNSFSKTFNMTGWRLAMALGNETVLAAMAQVKTNTDMGVFNPIQYAGIAALRLCQDNIEEMRRIYERRRRLISETLRKMGWQFELQKGTFYLWIPTPGGMSSMACADLILEKAHVVVAPGIGYGEHGEGFIRFSVTVSDDRIEQAMERLEEISPYLR